MRGTRTVEDLKTGIRITISRPAQQRIGQGNVAEFLKQLNIFLDALGAFGAYVSRCGSNLDITIIGGVQDGYMWKLKP